LTNGTSQGKAQRLAKNALATPPAVSGLLPFLKTALAVRASRKKRKNPGTYKTKARAMMDDL
jgi:hypothetical protein